ncbi:flagellar biosynthesis regulator FlaF [Polymorphum gilvum]|uniref:Flagellar protein flaF n=1 Tax=Polymorphum gilvum (strain LMG 25793 / CGMCC 1.9160 / SL003B-26A1) TaxID=991905 RepID=F2J4P0_POLGS|nr:flagellar biosynthesis regulator FlaF [Polymorphum gilvum]ADZ72292.1 Flagellar protein flaF [Polymorphum gilvum SL003B-26A1]
MYSFSYAQTIDDLCVDQRSDERQAMDIVIAQLERAREKGLKSREAVEAIFNTRRLWSFFIESLADDANELPPSLRADLISIGIWVIKEVERVRQRETETLDALIDVNAMVRDGLKG